MRLIGRIHALLRPGGRFISKTICLGEKGRLLPLVAALARRVRFLPDVTCLRIEELDGRVPAHVLAEISADAFRQELQTTYPFRFIRPK